MNDIEKHSIAQKSTGVSVIVNILLTISQCIAGIISGSQALIADAIHSLSDLLSDCVVLITIHYSQKAPDANHHYGHRRYENVASFLLGSSLVLVGIGMISLAMSKLSSAEPMQTVGLVALWVALASLIIKELLFRYMLAIAERINSFLLIANAWHARSDAASSLIVAIGVAGNLLGWSILDPIAAVIVGVMIIKMGGGFVWEAFNDLTDHAAVDDKVIQMVEEILSTPGILGVHDVKTRKTGDMILMDIHLEVDGSISVKKGHDIALAARKKILTNYPFVLNVMTHLDPVNPEDYAPPPATIEKNMKTQAQDDHLKT